MNVDYKLECLYLVSLCSTVKYFGARPEPKHSSLGWAPCLTHKNKTKAERIAMDKHASLLQTIVNNGRKKFYDIGTIVSKLIFLIPKGHNVFF